MPSEPLRRDDAMMDDVLEWNEATAQAFYDHLFQEGPGDGPRAGIDIFRFDQDGRIVEHWDVLQPVPEAWAYGNGMS